MKHLITTLLLFCIFSAILILGCDSPADLNAPGDKLNGFITFSDTSLIRSNTGYYAVSLYPNNTSAFNQIPLRSDSLKIDIISGTCTSSFQMKGISDGSYLAAVTWKRYPESNEIPLVLGTLGCDTSRSCSIHESLAYPNFSGELEYIVSWTDTTKKLY